MTDYDADRVVNAIEEFIRAVIRDSDTAHQAPKDMMDEARYDLKQVLMDSIYD